MPELPEVEAVVRKLRREAVGAVIRRVTVLRDRATHPQRPQELNGAAGYTIERIDRRGKTIAIWLTRNRPRELAIRAHLGMTGNLYVIPDARLYTAHVRVLFAFQDGRGLALEDQRLFGGVQLYTPEEMEARLNELGVDPLSKGFTRRFFLDTTRQSKKPAKILLMDQKPIAGLGNIYSAEALFQARIHPARLLAGIRQDKLLGLYESILAVLRKAIRKTVRAYREPGYFDDMDFCVYDREGEPCRVCSRTIQRMEQAGRSTYFCPNCQR